MSKSDPPAPPNPIATAAAQTSTNVSTAVANSFLNNTNQTTPLGSLSYDVTGNYGWTDPTTGATYNIPRWTATQNLSEQQQKIQDQTQAAKYNLANLSAQQSGKIQNLLANPVDLSGAPTQGDPRWLTGLYTQNNIGAAPGMQMTAGTGDTQDYGFGQIYGPQTGINWNTFQGDIRNNVATQQTGLGYNPTYQGDIRNSPNWQVTSSYGPADNFSADRSRVEQALYGRLNPQLALEQQHIEQQLADQGIRYGSAAYTNAMDSYNRQANDARLAVTQTAGQEQQRMMDMEAKRAGFQNAAQAQDFQEAQQRQQAWNQSQQLQFGAALQKGQFFNEAQQADFAQAQARQQAWNQAQQAQFGQELQRGQFANAAQQQAYDQALGRGTFRNQAQQNAFQQALGQGTFYNQAAQNVFNQQAQRGQFYNAATAQQLVNNQAFLQAQNQARQQYMQEQYAQRNQPINEITALLSGSQVQQPGFMQQQQQQIPTTDIAGILNQNFNQQFQNYQAQQNAQNQLLGGILGAAGNIGKGWMMSDVKVKKNIYRVGTVFAGTKQAVAEPTSQDNVKPLPIYSYAYKGDPASTQHIGPMAQDVQKIDPSAVREVGGVKQIHAGRLMGSILRAA